MKAIETDLQSDTLTSAYHEYIRDLLNRRSRIGCVICIFAIPSGVLLDYFIYPEYLSRFMVIRIACTAAMLGILLLLGKAVGRKYSHTLGLLLVVPMIVYVSMLIYMSEGILSPYYVGIVMVIIGACLLMPWTFFECAMACAAALVAYAIGCIGHWRMIGLPEGAEWLGPTINNTFMLSLILIICLVSSYFSERLRFREFSLQFELDRSRQEVEASYSKLEDLDRAKSQFFANISHELRTPLTLILSPLDSLTGHTSIRGDAALSKTVGLMQTNGMRLLRLINDLLDLVRLEEGRLELNPEPVDLRTLLPGLISSVGSVAERNGLSLNLDFEASESVPLIIDADPDRMEKVFLNLLFNAIKFTADGGAIHVRVLRDGDTIRVQIQDTGEGIAEDRLESVFDRFWQEDGSRTRTRQGTGIGLALVQEFVHLHGGTVDVISTKGEGSTFTVSLSASSETQGAVPAEADTSGHVWLDELHRRAQKFEDLHPAEDAPVVVGSADDGKLKHSLLIVEDEPDMQQYLLSELSPHYSVTVAGDGEEGLRIAVEQSPELIISDLMLPKIDGITLCQRLRSEPGTRPYKFILLTARGDDRVKLEALEAGADDFMVKPFSSVELKTRLANLLLSAQLERELHQQNITLEETIQKLQSTEAQLIQSERLSALGNLSAGIMHEINNPINYMMTAVHYLKVTLDEEDEDALDTVKDIDDGLRRIRNIITDLKSFAYEGLSEGRSACPYNDVMVTTQRLLSHELDNSVAFSQTGGDDITVFGNKNQLVQLFVNLIQNALQATKTNREQGRDREVSVVAVAVDDKCTVRVRDNGCGIAEEHIAKVFDPFFTTKDQGEGMGLGLSISHTIVKNHAGTISVDSTEGAHTEFVVILPLAVDMSTTTQEPVPAP